MFYFTCFQKIQIVGRSNYFNWRTATNNKMCTVMLHWILWLRYSMLNYWQFNNPHIPSLKFIIYCKAILYNINTWTSSVHKLRAIFRNRYQVLTNAVTRDNKLVLWDYVEPYWNYPTLRFPQNECRPIEIYFWIIKYNVLAAQTWTRIPEHAND